MSEPSGVARAAVVRVLSWGEPRLRDLPWRQTRDPWLVLVSEVMAQQTQIGRVVPKWLDFVAAYPTPADCAAAPLGDVLRRWHGLGYPRRARALHAAAAEVARLGGVPNELDALLALPGVGQYTARAVLAFAFELPAAVVDTNIARVLARLSGRRLSAREAQSLADRLLPLEHVWLWNQSLMELGSSLCRPQTPDCARCPLETSCAWRGRGIDPAPGSAGVSRTQERFEGSARQARGRLMNALVVGPVRDSETESVMRHRAHRELVAALCVEGLVVLDGEHLRLP